MSQVIFFIGAIGVIAGAIGVIALRDPFYSVLSLVGHLISLAILFLLLRAQFVAAVQVVVYAGAVMVLYVFVVAYVGDEQQSLSDTLRASGTMPARLRFAGVVVGAFLVTELMIALLGTGLKAISGHGAPTRLVGHASFGGPAYIGQLLLTRFLLVFEVSSFLLLIAAVGAVMLAGRSSEGDEQGFDLGAPSRLRPPLHLRRPLGTGTMAEGVGPGEELRYPGGRR